MKDSVDYISLRIDLSIFVNNRSNCSSIDKQFKGSWSQKLNLKSFLVFLSIRIRSTVDLSIIFY